MGTAGIQKALVKNAVNIRAFGSNTLVELNENNTSFTAYLDENCLGKNTVNPQKTLAEVKWLLVRQHVWLNYKNLYPDLGKNDFFNKLISELSASDYAILSGNDLNFTRSLIVKNNTGGNLGAIHILMPYSNFPEYEIGNIFVVAIGTPQILYTQFKFPKYGYIPLENQEKRAAYGQTVEAIVYTHLLPDWRKSLMKFEFEVELINKGKVVAKSGLKFMSHGGEFHYNNKVVIRFLIDAEWQKNHADRNKDEEFYLRIKGTEAFSSPTITSPNTIYNSSTYDSQADHADWMRMEEGKWVYDSSRVLLVPYNTFAELMSGFEVQKNEMIQYIGDIEYREKEYDPCGYKKIKIKSEDRQKYIFDEDIVETKKIDETAEYFEIISGDTPKEVSITVENLQQPPSYICTGVLLKKDEQHNSWEKIFQMENVQPAEQRKTGYQTIEDKSDPAHQNDRDVYASTTKSPSKNVASSQMLRFNVNYFKEGENGIKLELPFKYNKTVAEGTVIQNSALNLLWVFRYFWFTESMSQKYFVPISTCRYPNQLAKIKVYPDIEWEVSFLITTGETHTLAVGRKEDITNYPARQNLRFSDRFKLTSEYKGFSFATDISVKVNGDVHKLGLDKIENIIKKLADLKEFLDKFNSSNSTNASTGGFKEYFTFKLVSPNIALAFKWNLGHVVENEHSHKAVTMLNGALKLAPLIGVNFEVDLFVITDNIKVYGIGPITKFIRKSIEWVTETDIFVLAYVNVELQGEFTLVYNSINGFDNKKSNRKAILSIPFGVKGGIKSNDENVIILPTGEKMEKFNAEISINSGIDIVEELGTDNTGPYKKNSYIFKGLNVKVVIVENVFSRNRISVIPKIDETFEVLKEDKICPDHTEYLNNNENENKK